VWRSPGPRRTPARPAPGAPAPCETNRREMPSPLERRGRERRAAGRDAAELQTPGGGHDSVYALRDRGVPPSAPTAESRNGQSATPTRRTERACEGQARRGSQQHGERVLERGRAWPTAQDDRAPSSPRGGRRCGACDPTRARISWAGPASRGSAKKPTVAAAAASAPRAQRGLPGWPRRPRAAPRRGRRTGPRGRPPARAPGGGPPGARPGRRRGERPRSAPRSPPPRGPPGPPVARRR
jgi:hypothetical protein